LEKGLNALDFDPFGFDDCDTYLTRDSIWTLKKDEKE